MRLPFPIDLRVGTDIVSCLRILNPKSPNQKRLERLATRILQLRELEDFTNRFPSWRNIQSANEHDTQRISNWLSGRWAAKEAAKKAWDASLISWKDLRVAPASQDGRVEIICSSGQNPAIKKDDSIITEQVGQLSISHDGDLAIATVLAAPLHQHIVVELKRKLAEAKARVKVESD